MFFIKKMGLTATAVFFFFSCAAPEITGKTYAFIYGISDYSDYADSVGLSAASLQACQFDAQSFADALSAACGDSVEINLRIASNSTLIPSSDERPTKSRMLADFQEIASTLSAEDRFVFYFAGHGVSVRASEVDDTDFGEYGETAVSFSDREYLCLSVENPGEATEQKDVFLSDKELRDALAEVPCERKFVFLDCCHSGGMISSYPDINASIQNGFSNSKMHLAMQTYFNGRSTTEVQAHKNTWILAAAGETGLSYESSSINHGFFTYAVLLAFAEGDRNGDGFISWSELCAYAASACALILNEIDDISGSRKASGDMLVTCGSGAEEILFVSVTPSIGSVL